MTPATISSGIMPNPLPSTPFVPPLRMDWDMFFQPLFDELLSPPPSVDHPSPEVIALIAEVVAPESVASTGSPSSTTVDQNAPSPSNSQTTPKTQPPIIPNDVEYDNHDLDVAQINNDSFFSIPILEVHSDQSSLTNVIVIIPAGRVCGSIKPQSRVQAEESSLWVETSSTRVSKYALESLKKYGFDSYDPVDTPMVEKSKLDEDKERKAVDPSHYRGMIGTLLYLIASRPDLQFSICMCARYQARPTEKHLHAVKRIFRYLKGTVNQGLLYLNDSLTAPTAFADVDHASCQDTRRSTSGSM
nr:uncharacterized mitochondrial protein AtMg00810-like [Tanacetum cinerariifolium]